MKQIYSNATIVLAASRATSDSTGFLHHRVCGDIINLPTLPGIHLQKVLQEVSGSSVDPFLSEPLHKRAWAFQERKLATRTLFFSSHQIFWECKSSFLAEDGRQEEIPPSPTELLRNVDINSYTTLQSSHDELNQHYYWYILVEEYTACRLSFASDRLPAIAGLAELFAQQTKETYLAGVWRESLLLGLLWRRCRLSELKKPTGIQTPSWSWASVEGEVEFCIFAGFNAFQRGLEYLVKLQGHTVETDHGPFSHVQRASLALEGPLFPVLNWRGPFDMSYFPEMPLGGSGVYLRSFGHFHHTFDRLFAIRALGGTLLICGILDFPQNHEDATDLFILFVARPTPSQTEVDTHYELNNEGLFGLVVQRSNSTNEFSRVGMVHGRLMEDSDVLNDSETFENYPSRRKQEYLYALGRLATPPSWQTLPLDETESRLIQLA